MPRVVLQAPLTNTGFGTFGFHLARELVPLIEADGVQAQVISRWPVTRAVVAADSPDPKVRAVHAALERQPAGHADIAISMFDATEVHPVPGQVRVAYTMWEGSQVPPAFAERLRAFHLVAVPSAWNRDALDHALAALPPGPRPGTTVWPGAAPDAALADAPPGRYRTDAFTFCNVGKYERRKGIAPLVAAYAQVAAAHRGMPMRLLANWVNFFDRHWLARTGALLAQTGFVREAATTETGLTRFRHQAAREAVIELVTRPLPAEADVLELHRSGDAGIYPYFCEGWGLPLIETLACGVPCAATDYSAPRAFLAAGAFVPITDTVERPMAGRFYESGPWGTWREPTPASIVAAMATLLAMTPAERQAMGQAARAHLAAHFTWRLAASRVAEDLKRILTALRAA